MAVMRRLSTRGSGFRPERAGMSRGPWCLLAEGLPTQKIEEALVSGRQTFVKKLLSVEVVGDGASVIAV